MRARFLEPLLVGTKRHKLGLVKELVLLPSVGAKKSEKIEVFRITTAYCIEWFLSMNILLSFPFASGVPCLHG